MPREGVGGDEEGLLVLMPTALSRKLASGLREDSHTQTQRASVNERSGLNTIPRIGGWKSAGAIMGLSV